MGDMPEGDVVWRTAHRLNQALAGRVLRSTDFRHPRLALTDLSGRSVEEVVPRGKHILMRTVPVGATADDPAALTVHSHLRMDGGWWIHRDWTHNDRERLRGPAHQIRVILRTDGLVAVGLRLHDLAIVATADEGTLVGHLGPDLLGPDWDAAEAVRRLMADPDRPIGLALLDQRNLAGIGNLYRAETLFLRGVWPWTPTGAVADLPALVANAARLLLANRERVQQSTTGSLRRGEEQWVYNRAGRPCRRCGTRLRGDSLGTDAAGTDAQRTVYWCPRCQPAP
jgi:endonuclease-8